MEIPMWLSFIFASPTLDFSFLGSWSHPVGHPGVTGPAVVKHALDGRSSAIGRAWIM